MATAHHRINTNKLIAASKIHRIDLQIDSDAMPIPEKPMTTFSLALDAGTPMGRYRAKEGIELPTRVRIYKRIAEKRAQQGFLSVAV